MGVMVGQVIYLKKTAWHVGIEDEVASVGADELLPPETDEEFKSDTASLASEGSEDYGGFQYKFCKRI